MASRKNDFPCLKCDTHVKRNDRAVQCSMCELWIHQKCAEISDVLFDELFKMSKLGRINWTCKSCSVSTEKLTKMYVAIDKKVTALETKLTEGENDRIKIKDSVEAMDKKIDKVADATKESTEIMRKSVFAELRDRESRKTNIVIHQLAEADKNVTSPEDRKKADEESLNELFTAIKVDLKLEDIKFMARIGKKDEQGKKNRPLMVGFFSVAHRTALLNSARNLSYLQDYDEISIVPDLTKEQREEEDNQRNEVKQLNNNMDKEEALNFEFRLVGLKGERRIIKAKKKKEQTQATRSQKRKRGTEPTTRRTRLNSELDQGEREELETLT